MSITRRTFSRTVGLGPGRRSAARGGAAQVERQGRAHRHHVGVGQCPPGWPGRAHQPGSHHRGRPRRLGPRLPGPRAVRLADRGDGEVRRPRAGPGEAQAPARLQLHRGQPDRPGPAAGDHRRGRHHRQARQEAGRHGDGHRPERRAPQHLRFRRQQGQHPQRAQRGGPGPDRSRPHAGPAPAHRHLHRDARRDLRGHGERRHPGA